MEGIKITAGIVLGLAAVINLRAANGLERIVVAADERGFVTEQSHQAFHPWGLNYGNSGRLMEDFWDTNWTTFASDFRQMKAMGANVVRLHLQVGKFMDGPDKPNAVELRQLARTLELAHETKLYLDLTGLACYRPADVPAWYNALDDAGRWKVEARFWEAVARTCSGDPAVFCYDLVNEPLAAGDKRGAGKWSSGALFGGYDFLQYINLDPKGRPREEIPVEWIRRMRRAISKYDPKTMVTVGLLPWDEKWHFLSGFVPEKVAPELDFLCVHIYPDAKKPEEAMEGLRHFSVGKPVVIEETFPLSCGAPQLEKFLRQSRAIACGWMGHYDGLSLEELNARKRAGRITISQSAYRDWLKLFERLKPEFAP